LRWLAYLRSEKSTSKAWPSGFYKEAGSGNDINFEFWAKINIFAKILSNSTTMYIEQHKNILSNLCRQYNVKTLYVFGSVLTDRFNDQSDIDMIVDIDSSNPLDYANKYFDLKFAMQDTLKRPVDLLEEKAVRNPYLRQEIDNTKQLVYAK
jgi:predicted nucleotidyltransferase